MATVRLVAEAPTPELFKELAAVFGVSTEEEARNLAFALAKAVGRRANHDGRVHVRGIAEVGGVTVNLRRS